MPLLPQNFVSTPSSFKELPDTPNTYTAGRYLRVNVGATGLEYVNLTDPMVFKGSIAVAADFPPLSEVQNGWVYKIIADVTDNDASKTNTGQSFLAGDEIAWDGSAWSSLGSTTLWTRTGTVLSPFNSGDALDMGFMQGSVIFQGVNGLTEDNDRLYFEDGNLALGDNSGMRNIFQAVKEESTSNPETVKALIAVRNTNTTDNSWSGFTTQTKDTDGDIFSGTRIMTQFKSHAVGAVSADMTFDTRNAGTRSEKMRILANGDVGIGTAAPGGLLGLSDANTYLDVDGLGNMTFTDTVTGTRTLKNIGCPVYKFIKATAQAEGDLHLTGFGVSKALIFTVRVETVSTDWDLYILQNDNGFVADDANIPKIQIMGAGDGDMNIHPELPYEDEDATDEVHLYFLDNSGANTADIYLIATELI